MTPRNGRFGGGRPHYRVDADGCWIWQGCKTTDGYARIFIEGKARLAHRVMWELNRGVIPPDLELHHECARRSCVRPDHLRPVSHTENVRRSTATKLTVNDVRHIRDASSRGIARKTLAARFGVNATTVGRILANTTWVGV